MSSATRPSSDDPKPARKRRPLGPLDTGRHAPLPGVGGIVLRCALFVLGMGATLFALRALAAPGGGDLIASKRQVFERRADQVDTLLLGSSHVYRGVVPSQLDDVLGAGGTPARSYNYGIQLPSLIELRFVLREALAESDGRLKRVVLEYMRLVPQIDPQHAFLPRMIYWHDRESALLAAERVSHWSAELGADFAFVERTETGRDGQEVLRRANSTTGFLDRALPAPSRARRDHVLHWFSNLAMVGRSEDLARGLLGMDQPLVGWVAPGSGYVSLEAEDRRLRDLGISDNTYSRRNELFRAEPEAYLRRVEALRTEAQVFGDEEWMNSDLVQVDDLEVLRQMHEDCRAAGAGLVVVLMPANSTDRPLEARLEAELGVPVLLYTDPDAHPTLYDPDLRYDSGHFNEAGARAFTDVLGADLLDLIEAGRLE